jgi:hypothetical protein
MQTTSLTSHGSAEGVREEGRRGHPSLCNHPSEPLTWKARSIGNGIPLIGAPWSSGPGQDLGACCASRQQPRIRALPAVPVDGGISDAATNL